jgi:predicted GIY-YIG superfamily endonuclease
MLVTKSRASYLVESLSTPGQRYVGVTADLKQRLRDHNASLVSGA